MIRTQIKIQDLLNNNEQDIEAAIAHFVKICVKQDVARRKATIVNAMSNYAGVIFFGYKTQKMPPDMSKNCFKFKL
jgi:hypothetical protein